jgi:hypothetical protein
VNAVSKGSLTSERAQSIEHAVHNVVEVLELADLLVVVEEQ